MRSKRENPKTGKAHVGGGLRCEERICPAKWIGRVPACADWWAGAQCTARHGGEGARPTLRGPAPIRPLLQKESSRRAPGGKESRQKLACTAIAEGISGGHTHSDSVRHCPAVIGRRCWPPPAGVPTNVDSTKGPACLLAQRRRGVAFMWHTARTHLHTYSDTGHSPRTQPRDLVGINTTRPQLLLRSKLPIGPPPPSSHLPSSVRCMLEACTNGAGKLRWQAGGVSPGAGGVQTSEDARRQTVGGDVPQHHDDGMAGHPSMNFQLRVVVIQGGHGWKVLNRPCAPGRRSRRRSPASPSRPLRGSVLHLRSLRSRQLLFVLHDPVSIRPSTSSNPWGVPLHRPDQNHRCVPQEVVDVSTVQVSSTLSLVLDTMPHSDNSGHCPCRCISPADDRLNAQEQGPQSLPDWPATANASKEPRLCGAPRKSRKILLT